MPRRTKQQRFENYNYKKQFFQLGRLEGFKKLYGYKEINKKKAEWFRLLNYLKFFPESINRQYQELTFLLEKESKNMTVHLRKLWRLLIMWPILQMEICSMP